MRFLQRVGVSRVVVVGSRAHVGDRIVSALRGLGISVERIGTNDFYETSVEVARRQGTPGVMTRTNRQGPTVILASGEEFADALVAGPVAVRGHHPLLLTPSNSLHPQIGDYLVDTGVETVLLMGGTAALSDAVEQSIQDLGIEPRRVWGPTRYHTAQAVAHRFLGGYTEAAGTPCFTSRRVGLAHGEVPFDSLSAGPLLGRSCSVLLLTKPDEMPEATTRYLDHARGAVAFASTPPVEMRVFGGESAVPTTVLDAYLVPGVPTTVLPAGTCGTKDTDEVKFLALGEDPAWSRIANTSWFVKDFGAMDHEQRRIGSAQPHGPHGPPPRGTEVVPGRSPDRL